MGGHAAQALQPGCRLGEVTRLPHQHEGVHGVFTNLQTRGACYFQKQI